MKKKRRSRVNETAVVISFVALFLILIVIIVLAAKKDSPIKDDNETDTVPDVITDSKEQTDEVAESTADVTETVGATETVTDIVTETEAATETEYVSERVIPIGIYKKNGKKCNLITEYKSEWPKDDDDPLWKLDTWTYADRKNLICDVAYFAVFTSNEEEIKFTYWDETWLPRWNEHELDGYKIGFEFDVLLKNGETVTATVLGPEDTFILEEYFELYLYDCVAHAHDSWYSHITEKTNYDDTHNVMIKITLRDGCYDIDEILMTAFVYTPDEINADGEYIGTNRATLVVKREE